MMPVPGRGRCASRPRHSEVFRGFCHQEAPQAHGEEEAPQAASQDSPPASQQEVILLRTLQRHKRLSSGTGASCFARFDRMATRPGSLPPGRMDAVATLTIISKPDCHLDVAREIVDVVVADYDEDAVSVEEVSILDDPSLYDTWCEKIPVVLIDDPAARALASDAARARRWMPRRRMPRRAPLPERTPHDPPRRRLEAAYRRPRRARRAGREGLGRPRCLEVVPSIVDLSIGPDVVEAATGTSPSSRTSPIVPARRASDAPRPPCRRRPHPFGRLRPHRRRLRGLSDTPPDLEGCHQDATRASTGTGRSTRARRRRRWTARRRGKVIIAPSEVRTSVRRKLPRNVDSCTGVDAGHGGRDESHVLGADEDLHRTGIHRPQRRQLETPHAGDGAVGDRRHDARETHERRDLGGGGPLVQLARRADLLDPPRVHDGDAVGDGERSSPGRA